MKIGTLLTAAIMSLSAVGGGLALYVAATKYQTMGKVAVAQSRLEVVRAVGAVSSSAAIRNPGSFMLKSSSRLNAAVERRFRRKAACNPILSSLFSAALSDAAMQRQTP